MVSTSVVGETWLIVTGTVTTENVGCEIKPATSLAAGCLPRSAKARPTTAFFKICVEKLVAVTKTGEVTETAATEVTVVGTKVVTL